MISASINHPSVILHGFFNEGPSNENSSCPAYVHHTHHCERLTVLLTFSVCCCVCNRYAASADAIRARVGSPPSRLVTWASNKGPEDVCLQHADVISFNGYPAWCVLSLFVSRLIVLQGMTSQWILPGHRSSGKTGQRGQRLIIQKRFLIQTSCYISNTLTQPFTISETGAGGIFEWDNVTDVFWSQQYQAEVMMTNADFALGSPHVSGITLWQVC